MPAPSPRRCLFFARVRDRSVLELVEFYREDLQTLAVLGYEVDTVTRNRDALRSVRPTIGYCWWHHSSLPTILWLRFRGVPVVVTGALHFQDPDATSLQWKVRVCLSKLGARLATLNVAISEVEARDLAFLPKGRAVEVPLSVDTEFFSPVPGRPARAGITVGQLNPASIRRKGIDLAIASVPLIARDVPDYHLHVVGLVTAEGEALVRELVSASDPTRITVHGAVSRERKRDLLRQSAVYLQMSTFEGFGLAALEGLSCGLPVVHSGRGSLPEVVGGAGVCVSERTAVAVAAAVTGCLLGRDDDPPLGALARPQAESMSRAVRTRVLGATLDGVLEGDGRRASEPVESLTVKGGTAGSMASRVRMVRDRVLGHGPIGDPTKRVLNVGCGVELMPNADNIDLVETTAGVIAVDLNAFPWPLPSDHYDFVVAINVMEHLESPVRVVEEIYRVLKPGGRAVLRTPYWNSPDQFADLTHRNAFGHRSFDMFDPGTTLGRQRSYYTPTRFSIERYVPFVRPFGVYLPVTGPRPLVSGLLRLAERFGRVVWSQEHWLKKLA